MTRPEPLPDSLARSPFSVEDARAHGIRRARLRSSDLVKPFHGVRTNNPSTDTLSLARAYAARMSPDQFFSHSTAAVLLGLRMPEAFRETELHVTSHAPARAPRARGVIGHKSDRSIQPITILEGMRVTNPLDTWCQVAGMFGLDDLVVMADGLVRRRQPLATFGQLAAAVDVWEGRRGCRLLRQALPLVRADTDSARETMLRLIVVRAGFPEPEVNAPIVNRYGARIAHADLAFRDYRTILEYDGGQHRGDEAQFNIDIDRLDEIMEERWRVIRVNKGLMRRRATLVGRIRVALVSGGWRG